MKTYELLSSPESWTRNAVARDKFRLQVNELSPYAVCWCVLGALSKCYTLGSAKYREAKYRLESLVGKDAYEWNDDPDTTYGDVVRVLKKLDL